MQIDSFKPVTSEGVSISSLFLLELGVAALVVLLVVCLMVYAMVRYRGRPGEPDPPQLEGNRALEVAWTAIPVVTLVVLGALMLRTMRVVEAEAPNPLRVQVVGHQYWWEYRFPDLGVVTANELHLPIGAPIRLELTSADVIHSFWPPQIGWKQDVIPNKVNVMAMTLTEPGVYDGACAGYCGVQHAWMRILIVGEPADRFDAWVAEQRRPAVVLPGEAAARGQQLFMNSTCVNCHAIKGTPANQTVGPDLTHLGSRATLGAGVLENTPDNLALWIRDVNLVKPGVLMPTYPDLSEADIRALVEYLEGLK